MTTLYLDKHGVKLGFSNGQLTMKLPDGGEQSLPLMQIDLVIVLGHAHFSHDAIAVLLREDIPVIFSSLRGGFRGCLSGRSGRQILRRQRQLDAMRDPSARLEVARALVQAKVRGHVRLLRQWKIPAARALSNSLLSSRHSSNLDSLRGHEGAAARAFFDGLREHIEKSQFRFERRMHHPPPDPVNALLSLTYTLLMNEVEVGVVASGLDAAGGFYHAAEDGRPTLLMDLVEPLRPLADRFSARLLNSELQPGDFELVAEGCRLCDGRRGLIYKSWERFLGESLTWRNEKITWRRLIHLQARELAHWLDGQTDTLRFWHMDDN